MHELNCASQLDFAWQSTMTHCVSMDSLIYTRYASPWFRRSYSRLIFITQGFAVDVAITALRINPGRTRLTPPSSQRPSFEKPLRMYAKTSQERKAPCAAAAQLLYNMQTHDASVVVLLCTMLNNQVTSPSQLLVVR